MKNLQILLIENNTENWELLESWFSPTSHHLFFASDLSEGVAQIQKIHFDICFWFLNNNLNDIDDLFSSRSFLDNSPELPVIGILENGEQAPEYLSKLPNMKEMLSKPLSPQIISRIILRWCET